MKKKILIANSHIPWGGLGQLTLTLSKGLMKDGHDVYGLVTHHNDQLFNDFSTSTVDTTYLGEFNKLKRYYKCVEMINKLKPDVIIINHLATVHFILPFISPKKVLSIIHSDQDDFYRIASINKRFVDQWIAPSKKVHDGFINYLGTSKYNSKISIIPHGVAKSFLISRNKNFSTFNIVFIGALFKHKGVDLLPEIFSGFKSECPDSYLTIIGDGDLKSFLIESFERLGLSQSVKFTGVISNIEVRKLLHGMDVLCFPTRLESFGLVIIEAMMEGVVPIVTFIKDISDHIVFDGETGFLVERDHFNDFVSKLKTLYQNRELLVKMANSALNSALIEYCEERVIERYSRVLEKSPY